MIHVTDGVVLAKDVMICWPDMMPLSRFSKRDYWFQFKLLVDTLVPDVAKSSLAITDVHPGDANINFEVDGHHTTEDGQGITALPAIGGVPFFIIQIVDQRASRKKVSKSDIGEWTCVP